jgi:hypothetical protein
MEIHGTHVLKRFWIATLIRFDFLKIRIVSELSRNLNEI